MDALAKGHTQLLAFDCEFWRANDTFYPRELGGFLLKKKDQWKYEGEFLVTFLPPPKQHVSYVSSAFANVTEATKKKLDALQNRIQNDKEELDAESVAVYISDSIVKKHHEPPSFLKRFMKVYSQSLIIVKGPSDVEALKRACILYKIPYQEPKGIVDIAKWNNQSHKRCGTAKLEGTYTCLKRELKQYDFLPLGRPHDPRSDAAMAFLIAIYMSKG